jgi:cell division septation protein DedD
MAVRFRAERDAACTAQSVPAPAAAAPPASRGSPPAASRGNATTPSVRPSGRYAVQSAAVRDAGGARDLVRRLEAAGFPARIIVIGESTLLRVRAGFYERQEDAQVAARRMRSAGFDAIVVDDAREERATNR